MLQIESMECLIIALNYIRGDLRVYIAQIAQMNIIKNDTINQRFS